MSELVDTSRHVDKWAPLCVFAKPPIPGRVKTRVAEWFDIDEPSDLDHFRNVVPREDATRTWSVLETTGAES